MDSSIAITCFKTQFPKPCVVNEGLDLQRWAQGWCQVCLPQYLHWLTIGTSMSLSMEHVLTRFTKGRTSSSRLDVRMVMVGLSIC